MSSSFSTPSVKTKHAEDFYTNSAYMTRSIPTERAKAVDLVSRRGGCIVTFCVDFVVLYDSSCLYQVLFAYAAFDWIDFGR
jgi:hypothetical protein